MLKPFSYCGGRFFILRVNQFILNFYIVIINCVLLLKFIHTSRYIPYVEIHLLVKLHEVYIANGGKAT